ncbi:MAG: zinc-dependent peptidase [Actinobacteria bacterium]|nr:zinc-dependent peptidase [Actinomycetota bacterium]
MRFLPRRRPRTLPDNWIEIVEHQVAHWSLLDDGERKRLGELMAEIVEGKRWEAANGFALTDEIRTVVAAQAALLILGLDFDWYRAVRAIVVHPSEVVSYEPRPGPVEGTMEDGPFTLLGLADHRLGPILIAWDAAKANARHPAWGHDVVLHEFAHKLDMLDDVINGTPPLHRREDGPRWHEVCTREFERLRAGEGWPLRDYGAQDPGEFFAVATEAFFSLSLQLEEAKPELYDVLRSFYRQDPAARVRRKVAAS